MSRRCRTAALFAAALAGLALPTAPVPLASAAAPTAVDDGSARIIVARRAGTTAAELRARAGGERIAAIPGLRAEVLLVPAANRDRILARLNRGPGVRFAEPDARLALMGPDRMAEQWGLARIRAPSVWPLSTGAGITVAVVDSGYNPQHEDLPATRIAPGGVDFIEGGFPADEDGHGTHVTATIVGDSDAQGISGVAPSARALPLRALAGGGGFVSDIAAAFDYGAQRARIVSASLGGETFSDTLDEVIRAHPDTLFVVAAGNDGSDNDTVPTYPCVSRALNVICVGASDEADQRAGFSNVGRTTVDVFAPGVDILSGWINGASSFAFSNGTSMATPHVSGIAALVRARNPALSAVGLKNAVLNGVQRLPALEGLAVTAGRVDAVRAVTETPPDSDADGIGDAWDVCRTVADGNQADSDLDGAGDACDDGDADGITDLNDACPTVSAPRSTNGCLDTVDTDGDTVFDVVDRCPSQAGLVALSGCPDTRDGDGDGRVDSLDACPQQPSASASGCPRPRVRSVSARATRCGSRRCLKVRVRLARAAALTVTAQRCRRRGRACTWRTVLTRRVSAPRRTFSLTLRETRAKRLIRGRYRVRAIGRNPAGSSRPRSDLLRLR
jgi:subtilisin family serine protease